MKNYDVVIVGGGPGGTRAAEILAQAGKAVCIIEKDKIGGTCLHKGCIPYKTMLHKAKLKEQMAEGLQTGCFTGELPQIHLGQLAAEKEHILENLRKSLSVRLQQLGVELLQDYGYLKRKDSSGKFVVKAGEREIWADYLILATGSTEKRLYAAQGIPIASEYMLSCKTPPESLTVIGAGVVGLETAAFFRALGVRVEVVEKTDRIAGGMDQELADAYSRILNRRGIVIRKNSSIQEAVSGVFVEATGRTSNYDAAMLDNNQIQYDERGILCNSYGETSLQGCYVCGDANGISMLAHTAYLEAETVAGNILGKQIKTDYRYIPKVIYTNPEAAWIGLTQEQCVQQGIFYDKAVLPMSYSGRHMAENKKDGAIFKLLYEKSTKRVLGAHMIGNYASEIILALEVMIKKQMTVSEIGHLIYPHPTAGEIIGQAVQMIMEKENETNNDCRTDF